VDTVVGDAASLLDWRSHRCWNGCRHFLPWVAGQDAHRELRANYIREIAHPTSSRSLVSQTAGASTTFWWRTGNRRPLRRRNWP
jgi:hypothetical protein